MATVYNGPDEVQVPELNFRDIPAYNAAIEKYITDLKEFCIKRNPSEHVGEVLSFPVADGKALYMVAALKPVQLIHMEVWDAYSFPMAHRLTKKDIIEQIARQKAIKELFSKKKD